MVHGVNGKHGKSIRLRVMSHRGLRMKPNAGIKPTGVQEKWVVVEKDIECGHTLKNC